jgi:CDP-glycerol glycerophosphotransferase (TagB/SpsB family)
MGLTAWPAQGQWRGADGQVVREDSHVLNLLHPADASAEREIRAIIAEYKKQFAQEAVLRVRSNVCTSL